MAKDIGDYRVGDTLYYGILPCSLWKCTYCHIRKPAFGTCSIQTHKVRPNRKSCGERKIIPTRLIKKELARWKGNHP